MFRFYPWSTIPQNTAATAESGGGKELMVIEQMD